MVREVGEVNILKDGWESLVEKLVKISWDIW